MTRYISPRTHHHPPLRLEDGVMMMVEEVEMEMEMEIEVVEVEVVVEV